MNEMYINPFRADPGQKDEYNINFYCHFSLWWHKRFYTKKCENKNV